MIYFLNGERRNRTDATFLTSDVQLNFDNKTQYITASMKIAMARKIHNPVSKEMKVRIH